MKSGSGQVHFSDLPGEPHLQFSVVNLAGPHTAESAYKSISRALPSLHRKAEHRLAVRAEAIKATSTLVAVKKRTRRLCKVTCNGSKPFFDHLQRHKHKKLLQNKRNPQYCQAQTQLRDPFIQRLKAGKIILGGFKLGLFKFKSNLHIRSCSE